MKILTWNTFGLPFFPKKAERMDSIKRILERVKPDIAGLQEVIMTSDAKRFDNAIYQEKNLLTRAGLVTIYNPKTIQLKNTETITYNKQGRWWRHPEQFFDMLISKGFQASEVYHQDIGDFIFINTHLLSSEGKDPHQLQQFEQLFSYVDKKLDAGNKVLLAGDLNITIDTDSYQKITGLMKDFANPQAELDYILGSPELSSIDQRIAKYTPHLGFQRFMYPSDHPCLVSEVSSQQTN
jgi:endonuclease/exonuclease/phosphatase family metal-dependent hydrolase